MRTRLVSRVLGVLLIVVLLLSALPALAGSSDVTNDTLPASSDIEAGESVGEVYQVTLITGDVVTVTISSDGQRSFAISPADPTKLGQNFLTIEQYGDTYIIPSGVDLEKLDMELFNINYLVDEQYYEQANLPLLVSYLPSLTRLQVQALENKVNALGQGTEGYEGVFTITTQLAYEDISRSYSTLISQPEIDKIWLDRKVNVRLMDSVPLIGAPSWWETGYTGEGVEIAVLDTGIDSSHPDLDDLDDDPATIDPKVIMNINFSDDQNFDDRYGHGTHVAGIAAGTGAMPGFWNLFGTERLTTDPATDWDSAWSPLGDKIAFSSNRDGNWDIFLYDVATGNISQLLALSSNETTPAWSPDGTTIVFQRGSNIAEENGIWTVSANGTGLTRVYQYGGIPTWSPGGTEIAFELADDIWAINVSGNVSSLRQITSNPAKDWHPAWSPDGSKIAFTSSSLLWKFGTEGAVFSSPAIGADGTIYFGSDDDRFYAVNPDGTQKWHFSTALPIRSSPAIVDDGTIYFGSEDHRLFALNPNGTEKWHFTAENSIFSSPAIGADGTIYFTSEDHFLYAITDNGTSYTEKWRFETGDRIYSSPVIAADGTIYFGSNDGKLYALTDNGDSYAENWQFATGGHILSAPAVAGDGTVYVASHDDHLYALDPTNGTELWRFKVDLGGDWDSSPVIGADGTIYFGSEDYNFYALNPGGTEKWRFKTGGPVDSIPAFGDGGTIYFGSNDGKLYVLSPDGTEKWRFSTNGPVHTRPAITAGGTIYFGSEDARFYALGPGRTGDWAIWTVSANGTELNPTRIADSTEYGEPAWSADGAWLAYEATPPPWSKYNRILAVNMDSSSPLYLSRRVLIAPIYPVTDPSWSPNGNQLVFTRRQEGNADIYVASEPEYGIKGVAPGAKLWNVKVLNQGGWGYWSWVINGINFASLGADGVAGTGDEADIINMSLGGLDYSDGTDPVSQAVNLAVERGLVVAVAAGNDGKGGMMTIGTPGVAEKAITVGASAKDDTLADFSSRGPTVDMRIKPDILAPGVGITSPVPYPTYGTKSGTSMATPHVAGAAALLLQALRYYGDNTSRQVKDILMSTAKDLGYSVYEQGSGRLDLTSTSGVNVQVTPASLNLGMLTSANTTASGNLTFFANEGSNEVTLSANLTDVINGGDYSASVTLNPVSFTIAQGQGHVSVNLSIDLTVLPASLYSGKIVATVNGGASRTIHAIFGFAKGREINVHKIDINGAPAQGHPLWAMIESPVQGMMLSWAVTDKSGNLTFYAIDGVYHLLSPNWGHAENQTTIWTIAENIVVSGDMTITLDERDTRLVDFNPNKAGQIASAKRSVLLYPVDGGYGWSSSWWYPGSFLTRVSPISRFDASFWYNYYPKADFIPDEPDLVNTGEWHNLLYSMENVTDNTTFIADYGNLVHRNTSYGVALKGERAYWRQYAWDDISWWGFGFGYLMDAPQQRWEWLSPEPVRYYQHYEKYRYEPGNWWYFYGGTFSHAPGEYKWGIGYPPFTSRVYTGIYWNYPTPAEPAPPTTPTLPSEEAPGPPPEGGIHRLYIDGPELRDAYANYGDVPSHGHITVTRDGDSVVLDEYFKDWLQREVYFEGTANFTVEVWDNTPLELSRNSYTRLDFMASPYQDSQPPELLLDVPGIKPSGITPAGETKVGVKVSDGSTISSVSLHYSLDDGETWDNAGLVAFEGGRYIFSLGELQETFVSLAVDAEDEHGNHIYHEINRAFAVSSPGVQVSVNAPLLVVPAGNFTATIDINYVENLDAANYDVSFDPTVLEITDPVPSFNATKMHGQINGTTIPVGATNLIHAGSGPADPTVIRLVQNVSGLGGVSGSGYLAELHFRVIGSGQSSNISLSNGMLSNTLSESIPATWAGDSVDTSGVAGDATQDGNIDARDITKVERIIAGLDPPVPGADANQDGSINSLDITKVERLVVGLDESGVASIELANIQTAVVAMITDREQQMLSNPVDGTSDNGSTNNMAAFPDADGVYILYGANVSGTLVNYVASNQTAYYYTVDALGTVKQHTAAGESY